MRFNDAEYQRKLKEYKEEFKRTKYSFESSMVSSMSWNIKRDEEFLQMMVENGELTFEGE